MATTHEPQPSSARTVASPPPSGTLDPAAVWFARVRELGDVPDIPVLHFETPTSEPRRWVFPHEFFDGARVMEHVLAEVRRGVKVELPRLRDGLPPSLLGRARAVWRMMSAPKPPPMQWRHYDPSARGSTHEPALGYTLFDPREASAIERRAEERGARLNSFLLWALDRAVQREVAEPSPDHLWAVSVSMRGAVGALEGLQNVAVAIPVSVAERASPAQVKSAIRAALESDAHWGAWYAIRLLAALGPARIRSQVTSYYARPRHASLGTFSSVGPYDIPDAGWVALVPPPLRTHPIAAGVVKLGGRLSLSLQVHPVLGGVDPNPLVARWRAYAEGTLTD